ncbi:MAG: hypothetical protein Q4G03_09665 [Planctomycetia bacterium]|nr:hypothetical protein [Planctomycetia bacterium]
MKQRSLLFACCLMLTLCAVGCGKAQVTGKVFFSDGQTPLLCGTVNFVSEDTLCRGEIDKSTGEFKMRTFKPGDGVPPGTYKVYITEAVAFGAGGVTTSTGEASFQTIGTTDNLIDSKYMNPDSSGLTVTVKGSMKYNITLDDNPPSGSATEE